MQKYSGVWIFRDHKTKGALRVSRFNLWYLLGKHAGLKYLKVAIIVVGFLI